MKTKGIALLLFVVAAMKLMAGPLEEKLYQDILNASSPWDKSKLAVQMGKLGTADAKAKLLRLLDNKSYWNREGAASGLALFRDYAVCSILLDRMFSDHMIDDVIEKALADNMENHFDAISDKYKGMTDKKQRERVIGLISSSRIPRGEAFLKSIAGDENSPDRELAFKSITLSYPAGNYQYIRSRTDDGALRVYALTYLAERGRPEDLGLFREIIDKKDAPRCRLIAYKAVNRWGDDRLKQRVFLEALREPDETLAQGGILVFTAVRSESIKPELCRLVRDGTAQMTRISAALRLRDYVSADVVPFLVMALDENFVPKERTGIDIFAAFLTMGISSVFDHIGQKQRKSAFEYDRNEIANHLKRITGADFGTSHTQWFDWAVYNGHTINGVNIIQYLFSGYKQRREKAIESSFRLLGYGGSREFFEKHGAFASDMDLSLALAKMLALKGYLREDSIRGER